MKKLITIALTSLLAIGSAHSETVYKKTYADWESRVFSVNKEVVFRIVSEVSNDGGIFLTVDRLPESCKTSYFRMNIILDAPEKTGVVHKNQKGAIRVDEFPVHNFEYTSDFKKGSQIAMVTVTEMSEGSQFLDELKKGKFVRVKFFTKEQDFVLRYSLNGYTQALTNSESLCANYAEKSDKKFFDEKPTAKSDKSYF